MNVTNKHILLLLISMLVIAVVALGCTNDPADVAQNDDPAAEDGETNELPDPTPTYNTAEIFKDGTSEYVLVFDGSDPVLSEYVYSYIDELSSRFNITLRAEKAAMVAQPYEKEIIVGDVRDISSEVRSRLRDTGDFGIFLVGDDLILTATDSANYGYLFEVLKNHKTYRPKNGSLTFSEENNLIYHDSDLSEKNYAEYKKSCVGQLSQDHVTSFFTYHQTEMSNGDRMVYRLYVPSDYTPDNEYPLMVLLHGAGERGVDNEKQLLYMTRQMFNQKNSPLTDAIILAPQCPAGQQWVDTPWASGNYSTEQVKESTELACVMDILDDLRFDYAIDENRIYAVGLSMGGFGTWDLLMRHGDIFAAGVPICGGADPEMAEVLADIPIWTFHGSDDTTVPVAGTREMAQALEDAGSTVFTYEELEGMQHGIWSTVADRTDVFSWLFEQRLSDR